MNPVRKVAALFSAVTGLLGGWFRRFPALRSERAALPERTRAAAWLVPKPMRHSHRPAHAGQRAHKRIRNRARTQMQKRSRRINWGLL